MSQSSIRVIKTSDVEQVISFLRNKYNLLSEAEIIKLALSEKYQKEKLMDVKQDSIIRQKLDHAIEEGSKVGDELIAKSGLKRENMTEQEIYDTFIKPHEHTP